MTALQRIALSLPERRTPICQFVSFLSALPTVPAMLRTSPPATSSIDLLQTVATEPSSSASRFTAEACGFVIFKPGVQARLGRAIVPVDHRTIRR